MLVLLAILRDPFICPTDGSPVLTSFSKSSLSRLQDRLPELAPELAQNASWNLLMLVPELVLNVRTADHYIRSALLCEVPLPGLVPESDQKAAAEIAYSAGG